MKLKIIATLFYSLNQMKRERERGKSFFENLVCLPQTLHMSTREWEEMRVKMLISA